MATRIIGKRMKVPAELTLNCPSLNLSITIPKGIEAEVVGFSAHADGTVYEASLRFPLSELGSYIEITVSPGESLRVGR